MEFIKNILLFFVSNSSVYFCVQWFKVLENITLFWKHTDATHKIKNVLFKIMPNLIKIYNNKPIYIVNRI